MICVRSRQHARLPEASILEDSGHVFSFEAQNLVGEDSTNYGRGSGKGLIECCLRSKVRSDSLENSLYQIEGRRSGLHSFEART